jgi:hypothetical protein
MDTRTHSTTTTTVIHTHLFVGAQRQQTKGMHACTYYNTQRERRVYINYFQDIIYFYIEFVSNGLNVEPVSHFVLVPAVFLFRAILVENSSFATNFVIIV